jgi:hypothetical protein
MARHTLIQGDARACVCAIGIGAQQIRIRAERVTAFDEPWVLLLAPIVPERRAIFRDALAFNMDLAVGALALDQGWLMLRATHALDLLDARLIDRHLGVLAREAARLRGILTLEVSSASEAFPYSCD